MTSGVCHCGQETPLQPRPAVPAEGIGEAGLIMASLAFVLACVAGALISDARNRRESTDDPSRGSRALCSITAKGALAGLALQLLLLLAPARVSSQTAITNANIGTAVTEWVTSPTTAAVTYGNIVDWNIVAVTSMTSLFASKPTFNNNIGKWNTASVSTMSDVCLPLIAPAGIGRGPIGLRR